MLNEFYEQYKVLLSGLQILCMACLGVYSWQSKRDKAQDTRLGTLEKQFADKVAEHEVRLANLELQQREAPKSSEVARLSERIDRFGSQVERLNNGLDRMNQFLLENK